VATISSRLDGVSLILLVIIAARDHERMAIRSARVIGPDFIAVVTFRARGFFGKKSELDV